MIDSLVKAWEALTLGQLAVLGYVVIGFIVAFAILISRRPRYGRDTAGRPSLSPRDSERSTLWWVFLFLPVYGVVGFVIKILLWPVWFTWLILEENEDHLTKR